MQTPPACLRRTDVSSFRMQLLCRCLVLSALSSASGLSPPASSPGKIVTVAGEDVRLPCDVGDAAACSLAVTVEWMRTDGASSLLVQTLHLGGVLRKEQGEEYDGRTAATSNCSLTLLAPRVQDTGTYRCVLVRRGGETKEASVSLVVAEVLEVKPVVLGVLVGVAVGIVVVVAAVCYWKRRFGVRGWSLLRFHGDLNEQSRGEHLLSETERFTEYGDIRKVETVGASEDTARAFGLRSGGTEASEEMAKRDEEEMGKYKDRIISVGKKLKVHPALIAGIISRQSQAGKSLRRNGYSDFDPNSFGLMQINEKYHSVTGDPYSEEHVQHGVLILIEFIKTMEREKKDWTKEQRLKGALACYIAGENKVLPLDYEDIDSVTVNKDFANDVIARAKWFAENGY